jgi:hypothetical protein
MSKILMLSNVSELHTAITVFPDIRLKQSSGMQTHAQNKEEVYR